MTLGLALSGGGSRAAAFHRGVLRGLSDLGMLDDVDVVSAVSGGSVFAAAWMAAKWRGRSLAEFLDDIATELTRGFIARTIGWRVLKLIAPAYTRSNLLAETFDHALLHGMKLGDLPERPALCMNVSVMNTGQVGRFSREGFSSTGLRPAGAPATSNPVASLPMYPVALAAAASAAFPIGLPPIYLLWGRELPVEWQNEGLRSNSKIALTDGGVLENLGAQTLLKSKRFGAWDIILSDAGLKDPGWSVGGARNFFRGLCMGLLSLPLIERVMLIMSDKQDRHMRVAAFEEMERSWLTDALRSRSSAPGIEEYLSSRSQATRRKVLFVRLNQRLSDALASIPAWRVAELAGPGRPIDRISPEVAGELGLDLRVGLDLHRRLGGDARIDELNRISTGFSALSRRDVDDLEMHARWQVHVIGAFYSEQGRRSVPGPAHG